MNERGELYWYDIVITYQPLTQLWWKANEIITELNIPTRSYMIKNKNIPLTKRYIFESKEHLNLFQLLIS